LPQKLAIETFLSWLSLLLSLGLVLRLFYARLTDRYRFFALLCLAHVLRWAVMSRLRMGTNAYAYTWAATEVLMWLLWILAVVELYNMALEPYPGIRTLGRWALAAGLAVSGLISLASMVPDFSNPGNSQALFRHFTVTGRALMSALAVLLVALTAFLLWYPVSLARNRVVHVFVLATYCLVKAFTLLMHNVIGQSVIRTASAVAMGLTVLCLGLWLVLLRRDGEEETVVVGHAWRRSEEDRLVSQLRGLNALAARARK
jgi:hypothetical protein